MFVSPTVVYIKYETNGKFQPKFENHKQKKSVFLES